MSVTPANLDYFTDVLCIWAYGSQVRVDELNRHFRDRVRLRYRFLPLFAAAHQRLHEGWDARGGLTAFGEHVRKVAGQWDHVTVSSDLWQGVQPVSSAPAHLFLKAVELLEQRGEVDSTPRPDHDGRSLYEEAIWQVRCAFFRDGRDIATWPVLADVAQGLELPVEGIRTLMDNGEAHAALHLDLQEKERYQVPGSPTFIMDDGRQRLYGNVGYRILEANVRELLRDPQFGEASWC